MQRADVKSELEVSSLLKSQSFTTRAQNLFAEIFSYHFKRKPVFRKRKTLFGSYAGMAFRKAATSPLAQLLKGGLIGEFTAFEILVKNGPNKRVDDTDLELVIKDVRGEGNTLFILITKGEVPSDDYDRLFRAFTRHQVIILPLGENDIAKLEKFVKHGNINACLVVLHMLADRITSEDKPLPGAYGTRAERQEKATLARLDMMGKLQGPQLRTLIKKLHFLISFEKSGGEVAKACAAIHISRKTFYLWCEKDPVFRELIYLK